MKPSVRRALTPWSAGGHHRASHGRHPGATGIREEHAKQMMLKGFEPTKTTTCMKCRKAVSRYYGKWGEEGLCRPCIEAMPSEIRLKVLRDLHPEDRKRWQMDNLAKLERG
jgi:hypothetical protein